MPKMVLKAAYVSLNGTDLSAYTSKAELKVEVDEKDVTTFASAGWSELLGGLSSGELSVGFKQDVAASALDATMWSLFGSVVPFEVRLTNAAVGTSNPKWTGNVLIKEWVPIAGSVGDVAEMDLSFPTSGAVARATA
ncbi:phage tail tube protein [Micromonospora zamorensis]|uniref:phage tail tube protein n=1 Tax=Micromonospora zamorensis TaxID=709883 RepID=UPI00368E158D